MIGQITITAGINVAASIYIIGAVTRIFNVPADTAVPIFGSTTSWYFQIFVAVVLVLYWQLSAKKSFAGPTKTDEAALRKLEAAFAPGAAG